ncbi:hypothetical protein [Paenibacillus barengoltzii]|jgi:hypothetical protein|uniref:Uncharacterized protein n=2 Tax=Paenibacillus barengoltzii TaxID=343517 RepID=R9L8I0_9BACL|nr:hypothetical protein C812_03076 [Paenibacillus barengoltzii G22]SMF44423.1 hypothetical protein SAMN02744102_03282 [Paenibacillus barengoltzii]SMF45726.1 hypothetical protein SAMN02744124_03176 [Paenibacillus barengoltzii J12]
MVVLVLIILSGLGLFMLLKPSVKEETITHAPVVDVQQAEYDYLVRVSGK